MNSYVNEIVSMKKSLINGNDFERLFAFSLIGKLIIDAVMKKNSSFSGLQKRIAKAKSGSPESNQQHEYNTRMYAPYWRKGLRGFMMKN